MARRRVVGTRGGWTWRELFADYFPFLKENKK